MQGFLKSIRIMLLKKQIKSLSEDLIILKIQWYNISQSEKQLEDLKFLLLDSDLDMQYISSWIFNLQLKTYGLLGK